MSARVWFYRVRVGLLSAVLFVVALYAWNDHRRRSARTSWERPLRVGLVLLRTGDVPPEAFDKLEARTEALEDRLNAEYRRHRPGDLTKAIEIVGYGPVDVGRRPPQPEGDGLWLRVRHTYALWRYTRQVDEFASIATRAQDARIYLLAQPKRDQRVAVVEGFSESGGWMGVAEVELDDSAVDLALCVAAHELLHLLGATDKYDETGRTRIPEGLPVPDQTPQFPQPGAEVMARNRVFEPDREAPPESLDELYVGPVTAREIGWIGR
jgi:hypothetical protein